MLCMDQFVSSVAPRVVRELRSRIWEHSNDEVGVFVIVGVNNNIIYFFDCNFLHSRKRLPLMSEKGTFSTRSGNSSWSFIHQTAIRPRAS
jgi:hypothetical protein